MSFNPNLYKHELEQKAFDALNLFPKFLKLKEAYIANVNEKACKIELLSSTIRLSENQFPEVYNLLPPICEKLEIEVPELYYEKSKVMNAYTYGSRNPYIVVTSELVEKLPADLISSVLAHECGHIACRHCLYHSMAGMLIDGIDLSPLSLIPAVRRFLTPTIEKALLFWDRCSELSADRAAVLCDETPDKTVDVLLKLHGYENINRKEFVKQAIDLNSFVNDSKSNKLIEFMLNKDETHPRLATRVYECCEWAKSVQFQKIIDGTYSLEQKQKEENQVSEEEIVAAEITAVSSKPELDADTEELDKALNKVNSELERYTSKADKADYAIAIGGGILSGVIDAVFVGSITVNDKDISLSHKQVNNFIQKYADLKGYKEERLKDSIRKLENNFKVAQDNIWKGADIGVRAQNHHLADFAHHPTPLGLVSAIMVRFLRISTFVNKDGEWHFKIVETSKKDIVEILTPAVITGVLNWLVAVGGKKIEEAEGTEIPSALKKLAHLAASTPIIIELAKCADNWFSHLVSDMGGSKSTPGAGMGIPGVFISLLYEFGSLPVLKDSGLLKFLNNLYEKQNINLRHEIPLYKAAGKQAVPTVFNEIFVRTAYFITHLAKEAAENNVKNINWSNVIPLSNRTVDRMMTVAAMTFSVADTADAAIHAALESGGNWVLFSGRFVTRFNFVGAGRAAFAVVKEISGERKEAQLIHEKMILSEKKAAAFLNQLQQYKLQLEEKLSDYLAEDIEQFMMGFDYMKAGVESGNFDLIIKGNVVIQRVFGREVQFTNQKEFDDLMASDIPLIL